MELMHDGRLIEIPMSFDVTVSGAEIYTAAGMASLGLIQVPRYRIAEQVRQGQLRVILDEVPPMPVSVLYPHNRHLSARVRVFVEWLTETFANI